MTGINLGGWLITEKWMTPSLYEGTNAQDEFALSSADEGKARLKKHYDTFITAKDFAYIAEQGIEVVRLPVTHGMFGGHPPYNETIKYVDNAFKWAEKYGLKILLDLHTAPDSQNGYDHSGKAGEVGWHLKPENIEATINVLGKIAKRYKSKPALWGIEVLNEPDKLISHSKLQNFYRRAYDVIREHCGEHVAVVISDAYRPLAVWEGLISEPTVKNMLIDTHMYQVFSERDKKLDLEGHLQKALSWQKLINNFGADKLIVGEWTATLHKTYDGMNEVEKVEAIKLFYQAQHYAFANTRAHFYWNYKTEYGGVWSYKSINLD